MLRDSGWNTTNSCEHDMSIEIDIYNSSQGDELATFLIENGIKEFSIDIHIDNFGGGYWIRHLRLHIEKDK